MSANAQADPRIVFGAFCSWWDGIANVGRMDAREDGTALPCCPMCRKPLFERANEAVWWKSVEAYEAEGHPGYRAFVEWVRGKCFPGSKTAFAAYEAATGKTVP